MTPEQQAALAVRLAEQDVAGLPEWQVADILNAPDPKTGRTKRIAVTADALRQELLATGRYGWVVLLSRQVVALDAESAELVVAAINVLAAMETGASSLRADAEIWDAISAALDTLQGAAVVMKGAADRLRALSSQPTSWADEAGFAVPITSRDVGLARGAK